MSELLVSTIIPTYNRANLITRAVRSALRESRPGDEVIIIDDGSTDNTEKVLAEFHNRIRYIRIAHSGAGVARNLAVKEAKNDLLAFLDSDDEWLPGKLYIQKKLMAVREDVLFCFSDFTSINKKGETIRYALNQWTLENRTWDEILSPGIPFSSIASLPDGFKDLNVYIGDLNPSIVKSNYINTDTLLVRRKKAGDAVHFTEGIPMYEEQECYGRLARTGVAAYIECETVIHYSHPGPRLTDADSLKEAMARLSVTEKIWGSNREYMRKYGELYKQVMDKYRIKKAGSLISLGRTKEARAEHQLIDKVPLLHRLLAFLPGPMARILLHLRRMIRDWITKN